MKTFKKALIGVFLFSFLLGISEQAIAQEELPPEECYGDVQVTNLAYYDPYMGAYVGVPVRCLPWWWDPFYLPLGWTFLTPAIVPVAYVDGCFFSGGVISFSSTEIRVVDKRFERFRGHIRGLRGEWRRDHGHGFEKARHEAKKKFGKDLSKPPPGFQHAKSRSGKSQFGKQSDGHPGTSKPDGHHGGKHRVDTPGKSHPPGKFSPSPGKDSHRAATPKAGPPPRSGAPASAGKAAMPPPAKSSGPPPPAASRQKLPPPARSAILPPGQTRGNMGHGGQPGMKRAPGPGQFGGGGSMRGQTPSTGRTGGMGVPRGGGSQAPRVAAPRPSGGGGRGGGGGGGGGKPQPQPQKKGK